MHFPVCSKSRKRLSVKICLRCLKKGFGLQMCHQKRKVLPQMGFKGVQMENIFFFGRTIFEM